MIRGLPASAEHGEVLLEVALQLGTAADLDGLLPLVLQRSTELLRGDRALFALYDDSGRVTRAVAHNLDWSGLPAPLPVSSSLVKRVLETGEMVLVNEGSDSNSARSASMIDMSLRFLIGVPVRTRRGVIGLIYVDSTAARVALDPKLEKFVLALSRLVGMAVENARLFEEQRMGRRLLGALVHDLRTPLSVVMANVDLLGADCLDEAQIEEMNGDIEASCRRMSRMVTNTLEISLAAEGAEQGRAPRMPIAKALGRHLDELAAVARQHELGLALEVVGEVGPVQAPEPRVWVVIDNLLFWAMRHARPGSTLTFVLQHVSDPGPDVAIGDDIDLFGQLDRFEPDLSLGFVRVALRVDGVSLSPAQHADLFKLRAGATYGRGQAVNGLGLSIVRQCVRHLGGRAWAEFRESSTTCFFTLPSRLRGASKRLGLAELSMLGLLAQEETQISEMLLDAAPTLDESS